MRRGVLLFLVIFFCGVAHGEDFFLTSDMVSEPGSPLVVASSQKLSSDYFVKVSFDPNLTFRFYYLQGQSISIVPTPVLYDKNYFEVWVFRGSNKVFSANVHLKYASKKKKVIKLRLTRTSKELLKDSESIKNETDHILSLVLGINPIYFYPINLKPFILPSTNRVTSPFGILRKYSDGEVSYHKGVDFSFSPDDNVYAANEGIVLISSNFIKTGISVYIYHGLGIITSYFHLDEVYVKAGDYVMKGQVIGKIGETGVVTGRHLHFGVYVYGDTDYVCVNPMSSIKLLNELILGKSVVRKENVSEYRYE